MSPALCAEHGLKRGSPVIRLRWYAHNEWRERRYLYDTAASHAKRWLEQQGLTVKLSRVPWNGFSEVSLDNGD